MKPLFVGIVGPSCSGKTTLIKQLEEKVGIGKIELIHLDDYWDRNFVPPIIDGHKNREVPGNLKLGLAFEHLSKLKKGEQVEIPFKVFEVKDGKKMAYPKPIILVEGFLLFYDKRIRELFDLKIYLDISDEEIIKRRIARNRSGRNREEYYRKILISEYRKYGLPAKEHSDLILNGIDSMEENVSKIILKINDLTP